jgi:hypothetical protein
MALFNEHAQIIKILGYIDEAKSGFGEELKEIISKVHRTRLWSAKKVWVVGTASPSMVQLGDEMLVYIDPEPMMMCHEWQPHETLPEIVAQYAHLGAELRDIQVSFSHGDILCVSVPFRTVDPSTPFVAMEAPWWCHHLEGKAAYAALHWREVNLSLGVWNRRKMKRKKWRSVKLIDSVLWKIKWLYEPDLP